MGVGGGMSAPGADNREALATARARVGERGRTLVATGHDFRVFARYRDELVGMSYDQLIDTLPIPVPFEVTAFLEALSRQRGKPVKLWRMNAEPALAGMLVRTRKGDHMFVVRDTSPVHVTHVVFHEVGHILLHASERVCGMPEGEPFDEREEIEAERFAYRLAARVRDREQERRHTGPRAHLRSAFGSRRQLCPAGG